MNRTSTTLAMSTLESAAIASMHGTAGSFVQSASAASYATAA
jgi:hypothetical protein